MSQKHTPIVPATGIVYAITDGKCKRYAYIDRGFVCYDRKMPRRSGTVKTLSEARRLVEHFKKVGRKQRRKYSWARTSGFGIVQITALQISPRQF